MEKWNVNERKVGNMSPIEKENIDLEKREKELFGMLDKGIDDLENNRIVPHDEAMKIIRERLQLYEV